MPVVPRMESPPLMPSRLFMVRRASFSPPGMAISISTSPPSRWRFATSAMASSILRRGAGLIAGSPMATGRPGRVTVPTPSPALNETPLPGAVRRMHELPEIALLDMGDFAGGLLKYLRDHPIPRLTIAGGFAKIAKLAAGNLDLHSGRSQVDFDWLGALVAALGGDARLVAEAEGANTANQVRKMAARADLPLADHIAGLARGTAIEVVGAGIAIEVVIFDRDGELVGKCDG